MWRMHARRALVRRPSAALAGGIVTHIERRPVDARRALMQWQGYVAALARAGWQVREVMPLPGCPDGVFIEDQVVVYGDLAVLCRSGAPARWPEQAGVAAALVAEGYRIARIEAPGCLDGGDVLKHDGTVWVGLGGRTNADGVWQLGELLGPLGARVVGRPVSKVLHLKSAVTALPDGTVVGHEPLVDDPRVWPRFEAVPEESGAHVVVLDAQTVLMAASAPRTAAMFRRRGLHVLTVDISEFEKLEGCVTCLSVRLRG